MAEQTRAEALISLMEKGLVMGRENEDGDELEFDITALGFATAIEHGVEREVDDG